MQSDQSSQAGAFYDGSETSFSVFSSVAEGVDVCLFDCFGEERRLPLSRCAGNFWSGRFPFVRPGQRYGFRVHGPWDPRNGNLCSLNRLLLDPCAKALEGAVIWHPSLLHGLHLDTAPYVPRSVVIDPAFDWGDDHPPGVPWEETIIYEVHVKGFAMNREDVPPDIRGTYVGLAHPACLEYLTGLGVTAVELLPVYSFVHRRQFSKLGLKNYWGYDPIGFCAPHNEYAASGLPQAQVLEFKCMVKSLHAAGIEVILDVVYNHTGEGGSDGGIVSFKGFDNRAYYRLDPRNPEHYIDYTGTQNTLNTDHPHVRRMILESLRYWVCEMHVDGFRFDLAPALLRGDSEVSHQSELLELIRADSRLCHVKLIAEPWDLGPAGYQLGRFPEPWAEWNDKYRDAVRCFWRGDGNSSQHFAMRFSGSADLFPATRGGARASVNFVTCHDGFTLHDLVSYSRKYNMSNGDENRDGAGENNAWNCGVEGETDDPAVRALRGRQKRNMLATLLLSEGVPLLLGGDEIGRTQLGNNNAYCQDNQVSWFDWQWADQSLCKYVSGLISLRRDLFAFRSAVRGNGDASADIDKRQEKDPGRLDGCDWFDHHGNRATLVHWSAGTALQVVFGAGADRGDRRSRVIVVLFNARPEETAFRMPPSLAAFRFAKVLDTRDGMIPVHATEIAKNQLIVLCSHSLVVLSRMDIQPE